MNALTIAMHFAQALERARPLTRDESRMVLRLTRGLKPKAPWTEEDDRRLAWLDARRTTAVKIARVMGRTPQAIRSRRRNLKRREKGNGRSA